MNLVGRQVYLGYKGWILSHGLNFTERYLSQNKLFKNPNEFILLNIKFIALSKWQNETNLFKPNLFFQEWKIIHETNDYLIWKRN